MASCSTSSIHKSFKYDVFLSFRGEDTRTNFIDHLYYALQQKSIHTYKDDERIKKGKMISDELITSIKDSKFYIIVFSQNYASSSWCLDELVKIMEYHKTTEHTAYPVFYDVEPSEVRKQSGVVGEAFSKHGKEKEEVSGKWREALKEAADLAGWELKNTADGHEAKFIQKIVEELSLELRVTNVSIDKKLVGMDTRIEDVLSSLETGFDDVCFIGIKGIGGGGKTTLARAVFDEISFRFEGKSFVENVREVSNVSLSGLTTLQNQVLSDILNDQGINVSNVYDGKNMMKRMMPARKVIVVLDDVDHISQLEALAGEPNWFKPGSVVIITTRDEQVLVAHRVKLIHNVNLLSDKEAICLFSRHAFGREIPIQGYEELSRQVVHYAAGLPLTLKVLGSFLCGKNELEWVDATERLKTIPLVETLEKLELSYMGLEEDYKEIFLNIACILKGRRKDLVIKVLESCGFHARNGLRVLDQKSLITTYVGSYNEYEYVSMHDHLEEMAMNIVRRSHPSDPNKHSRLWINYEIEDILANDLGTEATRYMLYDSEEQDLKIITKGLQKMKELRFLEMRVGFMKASKSVCSHWNWKFNSVNPYIPNSVRYLCWMNYPFRSLPKTFQANNLVALMMTSRRFVQLWKGGERKVFNKLRFLDLCGSKLRTLDLGLTPIIETLALERSSHLVKLHMPDGCPKLRSLIITNSKLRTFNLGLASNLERLILGGSYALVELQMPARCLNLRSLKLTFVGLRTLGIGLTPNLNDLILESCGDLEEVHMADECKKLISVKITSLMKLRTLDLGMTPNLEKLNLSYTNIKHLWHSICMLKHLKSLKLNFSFAEDVGRLEELSLSSAEIDHLLDGICMLNNLKSLELKGCSMLKKLPEDLGRLEHLEKLDLSLTHIKHLPDSICMLKHLKSLELICSLLEKLPENIGRLECLEELDLSYTKIKHLPNSICCTLKHVKTLVLQGGWMLEKLPEDLGRLERLKKLILTDCKCLRHIPESICKMKGLRIYGSRELLQSFGFTSEIQTVRNITTSCYVDV